MDLAENWNNGDERVNGEAFLVQRVASHLRVAFDVGANVGNWTAMLLAVNPACAVYAFEASPRTFVSLQRRFAAKDNVRLYQIGLGDKEGYSAFHEYGEESVLSSFVSRELSTGLKAQRLVELELTTFDVFCRDNGLREVDFVKVDTEGYEMAVLRGMKSSLAERRVSLVQFEYGGTWLDAHETLANAKELLAECGYELYRLLPRGLLRINYDSRLHECFKYANFAAVHTPEALQRWGVPVLEA
jgi:FkbM family methyltransferase